VHNMHERASWLLCLVALVDEPERQSDYQGVVVDGECRVAECFAYLFRVPELLMPGPPSGDGGEAFALAQGVREVHIAQADYPYRGRLDHRDPVARRIGHCLAQPGPGQR
jgi:hypothetical protein